MTKPLHTNNLRILNGSRSMGYILCASKGVLANQEPGNPGGPVKKTFLKFLIGSVVDSSYAVIVTLL